MVSMMIGMFDLDLNGYMLVIGWMIVNCLIRMYVGKLGIISVDSWMIGFNLKLVVGVWMGYDKNSIIDLVEEKSYVKMIWVDFMEDVFKGELEIVFKLLKGVIGVYIDLVIGYIFGFGCVVKYYMYFVKGIELLNVCYGVELVK